MSYLVLARKFRPQSFGTISGQEHISVALSNAIIRDRVPHALLFTGPRGVGKTTTARVLAKALNCTGREISNETASAEPCGECVNCKEISRSSSLAVWEIDGASNNSVDNVRNLIESLHSSPPPGSKYKIYIIDEVHMLSTAAFNALLKSLEEPPANTIFIFATTEPHKIPDTVISRCQRHDFRRLDDELVLEQLKSIAAAEKVEVEEEVFRLVVSRAQGGMRDAQSLFDRLLTFSTDKIDASLALEAFGAVEKRFFFELSEAVLRAETVKTLELVDSVFKHSLDIKSFLSDFVSHWRSLMICSLCKKSDSEQLMASIGATKDELEKYSSQVQLVEDFDFQRMFELAEETSSKAQKSAYPRYVFEAGVAKMSSMPSLRPLAELISAVENGETVTVSEKKTSAPRPPVAKPQLESEPDLVEEIEPIQEVSFNPSWVDFVNHVKNRQEMVLAAFLRRVEATSFGQKKLVLEASNFDISSLKEPEMLQSLKNCLFSYSGEQDWAISFDEFKNGKQATPAEPSAVSKRNAAPGSIAAIEEVNRKEKKEAVENNAQSREAVKAALNNFEGSKVEKVIVLDN